MRPYTAVGLLFLIYQLLDVSALYDDTEVNKRGGGLRSSEELKRLKEEFNQGPSPGAWYYIMGHPGGSGRKRASDELEDKISLLRMLFNRQSRTMGSRDLVKEFVAFLSLKERGLLAKCFDTSVRK